MTKKLTCYKMQKAIRRRPEQGQPLRGMSTMRPTHYWFGISVQNTLPKKVLTIWQDITKERKGEQSDEN